MTKSSASGGGYLVARRFVDVGGRRVHGRIMGKGPPALFIHSSPANSSFLLPDMAPVADRFTCFAFDTPGFGLSDPLPGKDLSVPDLADALAETLAAIGMPRCPVFGCHTGAAIALELAVRHPDRVTGLALDSLSCFTEEELAAIGDTYFTHFPVDPLGGHYSSVWTRMRDQSIWFPWFSHDPGHLNESDLASPAATDRWVTMFFDAQDTYAPAYRAAMAYRDGPAAIRRLTMPMVLTSIESDMLYPHLERVQPTRADQRVVRVGDSVSARRALMADALASFESTGEAPQLPATAERSTRVLRQFVDITESQLAVRTLGDPVRPPLLLIHDVPGAGQQAEHRMAELAGDRFVVVFDIPGCGDSPALPEASLDLLGERLWEGATALGIDRAALGGIGWGTSLAVEMAALAPQRATGLILDGLLMPDADERARLKARYAPPIAIEPDGSHWFRTWQMIRDMNVWWPWFTPTRAALRRVPANFDAEYLHHRTRDTLRQHNGWRDFVAACLEQDAPATLAGLRIAVDFFAGSDSPLAAAYGAAARQRYSHAAERHEGEQT